MKGQSPQERAGARLGPLPRQVPHALGEQTARPGPLRRVPGHWAGGETEPALPLSWSPVQVGSWPGHRLHSCGGTLAGLVDSQPDVSEEQLGRPCSFSQTNAAAEGPAVAEGAEAWAGRGCTPWGAAAPP